MAQNMMTEIIDSVDKEPVATQIGILCRFVTTTRNSKKPTDNCAIAIPMTAHVCPIITYLTADAASSN
jgi:hypothetical protein